MAQIDLKALDLNLLVTLDALLRERHVTRAALRLGRSQSTISHALGRLREIFEDPLLVPGRGGMVATARAQALEVPLGQALGQVRALFEVEADFEPATTRRTFVLECPDLLGLLLPELLAWMSVQAPNARLDFRLPSPRLPLERALESGGVDVCLGVLPSSASEPIMHRSIGPVLWRCLVRPGHPVLLGGDWGLERWLEYPHVQVLTGSASTSVVGQALASKGAQRRVGVTVPGFMLGMHAAAASDNIFAVPHVLAHYAAEHLGLVALVPPIPIHTFTAAALWHERCQRDPAHRWFRTGVWQVLKRAWEKCHTGPAPSLHS